MLMHRPPPLVPPPTGAAQPHSQHRRTSRWAPLGLVAVLALTVFAFGGRPFARADSEPPASTCPAPLPIAQVTKGMTGSGLTVTQGTQPERFNVKVLGVLTDGVAPGVDMIIVETDSLALDKAHGIWAGMSGSPVYTHDARWIGAVAYGLAAGPSKIGGLAAAEDMAKLLGDGTTIPMHTPQ